VHSPLFRGDVDRQRGVNLYAIQFITLFPVGILLTLRVRERSSLKEEKKLKNKVFIILLIGHFQSYPTLA